MHLLKICGDKPPIETNDISIIVEGKQEKE